MLADMPFPPAVLVFPNLARNGGGGNQFPDSMSASAAQPSMFVIVGLDPTIGRGAAFR
jgi:hypothetical protein